MSVSAGNMLIGHVWDIIETGKIEITFFVLTLALSVIVRNSTHHIRGPWREKKQLPRRAVGPSVPSKPMPPANVVAQLAHDSISMRCTTAKVLLRYAELKASLQLSKIDDELARAASPHTKLELFQSLVQCACRGGQPELVEDLLDDMESASCTRTLEFYESAMRMLAAKKCFKETLVVNERLERDGLVPSATTMSCLVSFAAELGLEDKSIYFFDRLCKQTQPSVRACMVVLRLYAKRQDWAASVVQLRTMWELGVEVDSLLVNIVLATGVATGKVDEAEALLSVPQALRVSDIISHNTILKGLAQKGNLERAFGLLETMEKRGVQPNLISYNTIIDAAVRAKKMEVAWRMYGQMRRIPGLVPDKCTCSTLVKALQQRPTSEQVESVLELVGEVHSGCSRDLGSRLYNGILYAALRMSDLRLALKVKSQIAEHGFGALSDDDARCLANLQARKLGGH